MIQALQAKTSFVLRNALTMSFTHVGKNISSKIKGKIAYLSKKSKRCENQQTIFFKLNFLSFSFSQVYRNTQFGATFVFYVNHCYQVLSLCLPSFLLVFHLTVFLGNLYSRLSCKEINCWLSKFLHFGSCKCQLMFSALLLNFTSTFSLQISECVLGLIGFFRCSSFFY